MIHSLLPLFLVGTLGASVLAVGLIEGLAESTALIAKVFSGALSDYLGRRKGLAVLGYALGALTKPRLRAGQRRRRRGRRALHRPRRQGHPRRAARRAARRHHAARACAAPPSGCASRSTPWAPSSARCWPPALMLLWANDFRAVFWVAVIPGVLAVALLLVGVREPARAAAARRREPDPPRSAGAAGRRLLVGGGASARCSRWRVSARPSWCCARSSSACAVAWVPLVMVAMNLVYARRPTPSASCPTASSHRRLLAAGPGGADRRRPGAGARPAGWAAAAGSASRCGACTWA